MQFQNIKEWNVEETIELEEEPIVEEDLDVSEWRKGALDLNTSKLDSRHNSSVSDQFGVKKRSESV
jgi:hypothetical protein